ncbi:aminoglycoside phosphotransferase family protein [Heyndrickxia oleronia]|uniref:Aminoglycoside phosphotransferase family protein n=1 Tax=Heyndrickxia oleronia TaxID=38875 RepID=A0AAW6T271_9BACI|nr:aminoglycoside phosphotransferase family protein [Heyndrickxia oleronia]MCM3237370.1 aminoglycoside phosphotransferase family protein [Heyndrickxia oleronia]MDH5162351.1 aminoglycoside phosphotransferase family protein [Heyndrickxia oleronia]
MQPININEIPNEIMEDLNEIYSIRFPRQGYTSDIGLIESSRGLYALKRTKGKLFCSWLKREIIVLKCLTRETNLPVPKVKKFVQQKNPKESWALIEYIEGETLRTALTNEKNMGKHQEIIYNFGSILSQIHLTSCPNELKFQQTWLEEMLLQAEYNLQNEKVDGTKLLLEKIKYNKPTVYRQTLIHGDFTIDNVLVSNGVITGVIDWSGGGYGDPRYDVSLAIRPKPHAFENEVDRLIFFEGYGEKIIDDHLYDYFVNGLNEFF